MKRENIEGVNKLINAKSDINHRDYYGMTPLMYAAWSGSLDVAKILVEHGADPHLCNNMGCNAAHYAATGGDLRICRYLYDELDVDFFQPNEKGDSALDHAIAHDRRTIVDWMKDILTTKMPQGDVGKSCMSALDLYYSSGAGASDVSDRKTALESLDVRIFNAIAP